MDAPLFSGRHAFDPAVHRSAVVAAAAAGARSIDDDDDCPGVPPWPPRLGRGLLISASTDPSGWPLWLSIVAGDALRGWLPWRATSFQKLEKIGSGTYSNVYRARDLETGRLVAMKKVRVEKVDGKAMEEAVRFMMREIALLRRLDHPNIVRLEGVATSRIPDSPSLYLIFEYLDHDLAGLVASPGVQFSEPQKEKSSPTIRRVLKIHPTSRALTRFEKYRDTIRSRASRSGGDECYIVDGNKRLRFYCFTILCSPGWDGVCGSSYCSACGIVRHGFAGKQMDLDGIMIYATSWAVHISLPEDLEHEFAYLHMRRAMLVCQVVAGEGHTRRRRRRRRRRRGPPVRFGYFFFKKKFMLTL